MPYRVVIVRNAEKDLGKLSGVVEKRVLRKIAFYARQDDPLAFAKHLTGTSFGNFRWRIGNFRVIFDVKDDELVILKIQHRSDVYRRH